MRLKDGNRWSWFYRILGWIRYVAGGTVIITGALLKADAAKFSEFAEWVGNSVSWIQTQAWKVIILGMVIGGLAQLFRSRVGSPRLWAVLKTELEDMRETIFANYRGDPFHNHRVTLFKRVQWCFHWRTLIWPWSGWLVPVVRSGWTTQRSSSIFPAPDQPNPANCGIAGRAWAGEVPLVNDLPDVGPHSNASSDDFRKYGEATGISPKLVRRRRYTKRSYCGIPVEGSSGPWGAIVIESTDPKGLDARKDRTYKGRVTIIGKIIAGAAR